MFRKIIPITVIIILALSASAMGQLTKADIDSLRQVGEREGWTFTVTENEATRRPLSELCGLVPPTEPEPEILVGTPTEIMALPSAYDWRDYDGVTPVKNQGGCGSCWAFGTVGTLECAIKIKDGLTVDLSEQYLINCNSEGWGCGGGWWAHSYHLVNTNSLYKTDDCGGWGPILESEEPYQGLDLPCGCPYYHQLQHCITNWGYVGGSTSIPSPDAIKQAILIYGPVGVGVYVGEAFQGYGGGVFNVCVNDQGINHAVVLVGWDDNLGAEGCWILRNSWGPTWGESGYMYIQYGCSMVGYGAAYVDYGLPKVAFWADTTYGRVPFDVNFDATTRLTISSWSWDFGDGGTADIQAPPHTFNTRGAYDITVEAVSYGVTHTASKEMYIIAYADTMTGPAAEGTPSQSVAVTISGHNTGPVNRIDIPVEFPTGDFTLSYDSMSTAGCRTSYFEVQSFLHYDPWFGRRMTVELIASNSGTAPELAPGEGPIVKLYFTIPGAATDGQTAPILLDGYDTYVPRYIGSSASYQVPTIDGQVSCVAACCQNRGDVNHSGTVDNADVVYIVDWAFSSGPEPSCMDEAEVDGVAGVNLDDLLYLVDYVYNSGPAPTPCP